MQDPQNILPNDGEAYYYDTFLSPANAHVYFETLMNTISWKADEAIIFGKRILTKRKVAWYADSPFSYTYSQITRHALPWTKELLVLKELITQSIREEFNSCLLNLYHNGMEGVGWHSDNEKELKINGCIASISLGVARKFSFKHKKTKQVVDIVLNPGSLLLMQGSIQSHWLHCLPTTKKVQSARINLTFRIMNLPG
jgi:alkylated DNA repair dioxygenase AlkB